MDKKPKKRFDTKDSGTVEEAKELRLFLMQTLRAVVLLSACLAVPGAFAQVMELHPWFAPYTVYVTDPGPFTDVRNVYGSSIDLRNTHWELQSPPGSAYGDWFYQDFQLAFRVVADPGYRITHVSADFYGGAYSGIPGLCLWGAVFVWSDSLGNPVATQTYPNQLVPINWGGSMALSFGSAVDAAPATIRQGTIDLHFGVTGGRIGLSIFGIGATTTQVPEPAGGCAVVAALALGSATALRLLRQKRHA